MANLTPSPLPRVLRPISRPALLALVSAALARAERRIAGALATLRHIYAVAKARVLRAFRRAATPARTLLLGPGPLPHWGWQTGANAQSALNANIGWNSIVAKSKAYAAAGV